MTLRLYNTLTRSVDEFTPLRAPNVSLYTCGPTVYNYAHIGNFRTFLFEDVLRRWLEVSGYAVYHVMNLTDVDDKTIKGATASGKSLSDHTAQFIAAFYADRDYLRILPADDYPRATEFIDPMIVLVQSLLEKGFAYRGDDGSVYFAIGKFPDYGKLSRLDTRELLAGAGGRTSEDEYSKADARDFVLWKAARPEDEAVGAVWDAPFGRGRPGWHLECSAMALDLIRRKLDARVLDIHAGGIDLVFPHHEDEIAQSCAHTGESQFAQFWVHGEFLTMAGTKMSKRFGNILTARDLKEEGVDAGVVRLLLATTHYRAPLDFTDQALEAAQEGSRRLGEFRDRVAVVPTGLSEQFTALSARLKVGFSKAMDEDLNTPRALSALFEAAREGNRLLDAGELPTEDFLTTWRTMSGVLQCLPAGAVSLSSGVSTGQAQEAGTWSEDPPVGHQQEEWAKWWANKRLSARHSKDWAESDRIRDLLASHGWEVRDNKDGSWGLTRH